MLEDRLSQLLYQYQPTRLIVAGSTAASVGLTWSRAHAVELVNLTSAPLEMLSQQTIVADLALVSEILGELSHEQARQLLGELRNRCARRIAVCVQDNTSWSFKDMISLGFRRHAQLDDGGMLYSYDIETYNPARAWNNPDNWANPEMWGKYRW